LYLTLCGGGFWHRTFPPVDALLDDALATLQRTPCAKLRRQITDDLFRIADNSPVHGERVQALLRLADYFHTAEAPTNVH
jgi:hypothetical protein